MIMDNFSCSTYVETVLLMKISSFSLPFSFFCTIGELYSGQLLLASMHNDSNLWLAFVLCTSVTSSCLYNCHCYTLAIVGGGC